MLRKAHLPLLLSVFAFSAVVSAQNTRHFTFHYGFTVKDIAAGEKVRIWVPVAHSDEFQEAKVLSSTGDLPLKKTREPRYGNEMLYAETSHAKQPELHFEVVYDVVRHERLTLGAPRPRLAEAKLSSKEEKADLAPDKLVPTTGVPAELAVKVTAGKSTTLDKARAMYDYVFTTMRYDKTGTGWGNGDVLWACGSKRGNCTDFHSLFIAMARSQGIPARFEIGFSLPDDKSSGEIGGYHCWADFFDTRYGWVPVDISEAWQHQVMQNYFFGGYDANRIQFTMGRDLELNPKQDGGPLNYFIYPYVEVGGKQYTNISNAFSFADAAGGTAAGK